VGDSVCDIRAGKAAGAKTAAVLSGLFSCAELAREHPDLILKMPLQFKFCGKIIFRKRNIAKNRLKQLYPFRIEGLIKTSISMKYGEGFRADFK